ncbi:DUF397 domain-containing protein [Actinoplanes sp. NPDC020271]|uniref:DUF397 domain-containing protein n=1 Tax=Actinoplanes sp. NPDC020271 TaxID=3363896 RepID=UPI0037A46466
MAGEASPGEAIDIAALARFPLCISKPGYVRKLAMAKLVSPGEVVGAQWFKSSRSNNGTGCVEVALNLPGVYVRDTKDGGDGPILHYTDEEWTAFTAGVREGEFDK